MSHNCRQVSENETHIFFGNNNINIINGHTQYARCEMKGNCVPHTRNLFIVFLCETISRRGKRGGFHRSHVSFTLSVQGFMLLFHCWRFSRNYSTFVRTYTIQPSKHTHLEKVYPYLFSLSPRVFFLLLLLHLKWKIKHFLSHCIRFPVDVVRTTRAPTMENETYEKHERRGVGGGERKRGWLKALQELRDKTDIYIIWKIWFLWHFFIDIPYVCWITRVWFLGFFSCVQRFALRWALIKMINPRFFARQRKLSTGTAANIFQFIFRNRVFVCMCVCLSFVQCFPPSVWLLGELFSRALLASLHRMESSWKCCV